MAELLATAAITARIEEIIQKATKHIVIVSPYLRVNDRLKVLLSEKDTSRIPICVLYGKKKELRKDERTWLESMASVTTRYCKTLHAKCYFNENEALLTSMNLYDYSQVNNREMGILVTADKDHELYAGILEESERIRQQSEVVIGGEDLPLTASKTDRGAEEGPLLTWNSGNMGSASAARVLLRELATERKGQDIQGEALPHLRERACGDPAQVRVPLLLREVQGCPGICSVESAPSRVGAGKPSPQPPAPLTSHLRRYFFSRRLHPAAC